MRQLSKHGKFASAIFEPGIGCPDDSLDGMPQTNVELGGIIVHPNIVHPNTGHPSRFRHCA